MVINSSDLNNRIKNTNNISKDVECLTNDNLKAIENDIPKLKINCKKEISMLESSLRKRALYKEKFEYKAKFDTIDKDISEKLCQVNTVFYDNKSSKVVFYDSLIFTNPLKEEYQRKDKIDINKPLEVDKNIDKKSIFNQTNIGSNTKMLDDKNIINTKGETKRLELLDPSRFNILRDNQVFTDLEFEIIDKYFTQMQNLTNEKVNLKQNISIKEIDSFDEIQSTNTTKTTFNNTSPIGGILDIIQEVKTNNNSDVCDCQESQNSLEFTGMNITDNIEATLAVRLQIQASINDIFKANNITLREGEELQLKVDYKEFKIYAIGVETESSNEIEMALNQGKNGEKLYQHIYYSNPSFYGSVASSQYEDIDYLSITYKDGELYDFDTDIGFGTGQSNWIEKLYKLKFMSMN